MTFLGKILSRCARSRHSGLALQDKSGGRARKTILAYAVSDKKVVFNKRMRIRLFYSIILILLLIGSHAYLGLYADGLGLFPGRRIIPSDNLNPAPLAGIAPLKNSCV